MVLSLLRITSHHIRRRLVLNQLILVLVPSTSSHGLVTTSYRLYKSWRESTAAYQRTPSTTRAATLPRSCLHVVHSALRQTMMIITQNSITLLWRLLTVTILVTTLTATVLNVLKSQRIAKMHQRRFKVLTARFLVTLAYRLSRKTRALRAQQPPQAAVARRAWWLWPTTASITPAPQEDPTVPATAR